MNKILRKILASLLTVVIILTAAPLSGFVGLNLMVSSSAKTIADCVVDEIIEFGMYPQSCVTDSKLISKLDSISKNWISYEYFSGSGWSSDGNMQPGDWMKFADITYDGLKYRAVVFSEYRPAATSAPISIKNSFQDDHGYYINHVYYFLYEPIKWRVIDPKTGFIMCEKIIDSQAYNNTVYSNENDFFHDNKCEKYANDYKESSIRKWLNEDFYNISFNANEMCMITDTDLVVSSNNISDKIFLLSYDEIWNSSLDLTLSYPNLDEAHEDNGTDYAKCQGLYITPSEVYSGYYWWWTRDCDNSFTDSAMSAYGYYGYAYLDEYGSIVSSTSVGIRPALKLDPNAIIEFKRKVFNENSYIADIWLNRLGGEETPESKLIENILSFEPISTQYYDSLKNNASFQTALSAWNGFKFVFDTETAIDDMTLSKSDLYETLIFDLLKRSLEEKQEDYTNIILDAVNLIGEGAETVTQYKDIADNLVSIVDDPAQGLLDVLKEWKFDPKSDSFTNFYGSLNDVHDTANKWNDNKFVEGVGSIAEAATGVADFYERFIGYCMATDMSNDMKVLLDEMYNQTNDYDFQKALSKVKSAVDNATMAAIFSGYELYEDTMVNFVGYCFDEVAKSSQVYIALQKAYEAGTAFDNLVFGTSGTIDAYYFVEATSKFISANKAAINSLANKYKSSEMEKDASAYVFAIHAYEHINAIDLEAGANFVKKASDEGLLNYAEKITLKIKNWFTGSNEKTSYEEYLKSKDNILKCWDEFYYSLNTTWKYNPEYLKSDYPEMFLVFVGEEISKDEYKPQIVSAKIEKSGKTKIEYCLNTSYDINGRQYVLYSKNIIDGIYASECVGNEFMTLPHSRVSKEYSIFEAPNPIELYSEEYSGKNLTKKCSLKTYAEADGERVYSSEAVYYLEDPIQRVEISVPNVADVLFNTSTDMFLGIPIKIEDSTSVDYEEVQYVVYRKTKDSDWSKIATVPRKLGYGGDTTVFYDKNVDFDTSYTYKVESYYEFENGKIASSTVSEPLTLSVSSYIEDISAQVLEISLVTNIIMSRTANKLSSAKGSVSGIQLSWKSYDNAVEYEIYRLASYGTVYQLIDTVSCDKLTYFDNTVEKGVTYDYIVVPRFSNDGTSFYDLGKMSQGEITYSDGKVNSVLIDSISMNYKNSTTITPTIEIDEGVEYTVTYSSSDNSVAQVDENGNVYASGKGEATITCTVTDEYGNTVTDTCDVEVKYTWWQWIIVIVLFGWIWY